MSHTPGPWMVNGKTVNALGSGRVATVGGDFYDDGRKDEGGWTFDPPLDTAANARLIACAPALLEALIAMRYAFTSDGTDGQHRACRLADEALANATRIDT